ncbi:MAG: ATP-dependent Clp protease ATP-binding subunit [Candidatus Saccharibacteria bacterium]|nr:ATP-dependent Clp protease ATP-binding subunit [Candidatus Saccharibacteria bacterium]
MPENFQDFAQYLTDNARGSLQQAEVIARSLGSSYIGTEHLLLGLLSQPESVGGRILFDNGVTLERAHTALNLTPRSLVISAGATGLSETAKLTLKMSWETAQEFHQDYCGTEHILFSIMSQKNARASVLLRDMNIDMQEITNELDDYLRDQKEAYHLGSSGAKIGFKRKTKKGMLDTFGIDLTALAAKDELDPVIGRDEQINRMITILSRRTKNNPVLIGDPGVGKTAIVEGLAQRIASEKAPEHLLDKRIIQLDLPGMIAGTKYRGEFEERLKKVMNEIRDDSNIIVFVDELHLIIGAGAAEGSMDAANILKPALARGQMRLIGATTIDEYRKHIEKDAALERRLQSIIVPEPKLKDVVAILKGLRHHYEDFHGVKLSDEIIDDTVNLADRYVSERFMPDKAIDVIDEAASKVRVKNGVLLPEARNIQREINLLNDKMEEAVTNENYERAAMCKTRISQLTDKLKKLHIDEKRDAIAITTDDVAAAISTMTGIPVNRVVSKEAALLRNLEGHLSKSVIGQKEAIEKVSKSIRRSRSGIASKKRPIGSFIFMGPTGVGKTELARVLAREVFGNEDALIKIDMSEFGERHSASRLVGAPAGYVGYDDGGQLTDKIRRQPYSVVLLDEIEKAHSDVFQLLLQLLEDGRLTDAKGRSVDFSNTIVILTSNLGAESMKKEASLGFKVKSASDTKKLDDLHQKNESAAREALSKMMRPELINRFDGVIVFHALTRPEIGKIFNLQVKDLKDRLNIQGLSVVVNPQAKKWMIDKGYDEFNGARPLRRVLQDELEHIIADGMLSGDFKKGDVLQATVANNALKVDLKAE